MTNSEIARVDGAPNEIYLDEFEMARCKSMAEYALDEQYEKTLLENQALTHENSLMALSIDQLEAFIYECDLEGKFNKWRDER